MPDGNILQWESITCCACLLHREQYSAERMTLVVLGGQSLDELAQWAEELFSAVPSGRGLQPTYFDAGMPYQVGVLQHQ